MAPVYKKRIESELKQRLRVVIRGAVQGVGFRPFVFRLAREMRLNGWVKNTSQGVVIEVEGNPEVLRTFLLRLPEERPPRASVQSLESSYLDTADLKDFEIRESDDTGRKTATVLPDIATCPDCVAEIFDPDDRRYRYPFTNCTNCGPRFSIIEALPYDRPHTTMRSFQMCAACQAEYENAEDRRFHAQPNACPECGPHLELWNDQGTFIASRHDALIETAEVIRSGKIVALKGLGGFHLVVDARDGRAVVELRRRKHREEKPFAVMFPSPSSIEEFCEISDLEKRILTSPESPIVLLRKRKIAASDTLSGFISPANPYLGVMLPYTPLHHLLLKELDFPIVATSGNLSDEPICIDETEAVERLSGISDLFLVHNRPIARHVDDSIVRVMMDREMVVRRARGFAPLPIITKNESQSVLAVGAHLKNSVALSTDHQIVVSQHIGDLESDKAYGAFQNVIESLERLYEVSPVMVACDGHPDYMSSHWAAGSSLKTINVQHHYAHILSCMAENEVEPPALGVAWDGSGYGLDNTIWGGEFLSIRSGGFGRFAHLRTFRLPGGEQAVREPRRSAIGILFEIFGSGVFDVLNLPPVAAFSQSERSAINGMLERGVNSPVTSSAGRLFDAVASLIGAMHLTRFEGQAAMLLEFMADAAETARYEFDVVCGMHEPLIIDWQPLIQELIYDYARSVRPSCVAARFHNTLVEMIVKIASMSGEKSVALSGGCFQNKFLTERAISRLRDEGFKVYWHQRVPTNDGGISLGQVIAANESGNDDSNSKRRLENVCV